MDQKHVSVTAIKFHTLDGKAYATGDAYDADANLVASLVAQGMAAPIGHVKQVTVAPTAATQAKKKPAAKPVAKVAGKAKKAKK